MRVKALLSVPEWSPAMAPNAVDHRPVACLTLHSALVGAPLGRKRRNIAEQNTVLLAALSGIRRFPNRCAVRVRICGHADYCALDALHDGPCHDATA
jgi:hypothetical protein